MFMDSVAVSSSDSCELKTDLLLLQGTVRKDREVLGLMVGLGDLRKYSSA